MVLILMALASVMPLVHVATNQRQSAVKSFKPWIWPTAVSAVSLSLFVFSAPGMWRALEDQITDSLTRAHTQLDSANPAVRLGGVYALERIARNSPSGRQSIMEVLTAFVRKYSYRKAPKDQEEPVPPADIQAILTVIGRRTSTFGNGESQQLDLSNTKLQGANLGGGTA